MDSGEVSSRGDLMATERCPLPKVYPESLLWHPIPLCEDFQVCTTYAITIVNIYQALILCQTLSPLHR